MLPVCVFKGLMPEIWLSRILGKEHNGQLQKTGSRRSQVNIQFKLIYSLYQKHKI